MVTIPGNFRNLAQVAGGNLAPLAATADRVMTNQGSSAPETHAVVDALSELLSGTAFLPDVDLATAPRQTYEHSGHPDLLSQLWALVVRPVGKAVVRTFGTEAVETPLGTVFTEVQTSAEYVERPLTPEEVLYLQRKNKRLGNRALPGDLDYLTHPERR